MKLPPSPGDPPPGGGFFIRRTAQIKMLLVFHRFVNLKGLLRGIPLMDHLADGLGHAGGAVGLEDVPAHVHPAGPLRDGPVGHLQGLQLRKLLSSDGGIFFYTPVGLEIGFNYNGVNNQFGWMTATIKDYEEYLKKM